MLTHALNTRSAHDVVDILYRRPCKSTLFPTGVLSSTVLKPWNMSEIKQILRLVLWVYFCMRTSIMGHENALGTGIMKDYYVAWEE